MEQRALATEISVGPSRFLVSAMAILLSAGLLSGVFWFGRLSASRQTLDEEASVANGPVVPAEQVVVQEAQSDEQMISSLLGEVLVLADTTFDSGVRVLIVCSLDEKIPSNALVEFVQLETSRDQFFVAQRIGVTSPTRLPECGACSVVLSESLEVDNPVVYGNCLDGGTNGFGTAFVISSPSYSNAVALDLVVACGGTWFDEQDGELVLHSHSWLGAGPVFYFPEVRFSHRSGSGFAPDDEAILRHYCDIKYGGGLIVSNGFSQSGPDLPYDLVETEIGVLGLYSHVLIGLEREICNLLYDVVNANLGADEPVNGAVASLVGLDPPDDSDDWHVTCQAAN